MDNNSSILSSEELKRYNRHIILPEIGKEGQEKLKKASVLVVGAGGLGSPVLLYLAAAGVGRIGVIDDDVVDESNLQRQVLFTTEDIGKKKIIVAKRKLEQLNPNVMVEIFDCRLTNENASKIVKNYDVVADCPDNFATRYITNDACVKNKIPFVYGSISQFEGQVSVFAYKDGPVYRDVFPESPDVDEDDESRLGVLGVLPGIIGCLQANEVIKIHTGIGEVMSGKLFVFNSLSMSSYSLKINSII